MGTTKANAPQRTPSSRIWAKDGVETPKEERAKEMEKERDTPLGEATRGEAKDGAAKEKETTQREPEKEKAEKGCTRSTS